MNGEVPSVPITTLAGITSLTDLLPELPLPTPLSTAVSNKSLLHNAKLSEKSKRLLNDADDRLVEQVSAVLQKCTTEHIELKDMLAGDGLEGDLPELCKALLASDPHIFTGGKKGSRSHNGNQSPSSLHQRPHRGSCASVNSGSVHKSPSLPGSSDHFSNQSSSNINGEPFDKRCKRTATATMNSPAQATMAESIMRQSAPRSSRSDRTSDPEAIEIDDDEEDEGPADRRTRSRSGESKKSSDSKTKSYDSWAAKMRQIGEVGKPVVMLEMLDPKRSYGDFYRKKEDPWNSQCRPLKVSLEPLDERTLKSIAEGGTVRTDPGKRGSKRHRDRYDDYDKTKRRRHYDDSEDSEEENAEQLLRRKKKEKRQRRMNQVDLTIDELLDSPTFKKFSTAIEYIFDSAEDINFGSLDPNDEEVECPPESLIARSVLSELASETAKLKTMGVLNQVPANTLVKLLTILQWNIRDGTKLLPLMNQDNEDEDDEGQKLWQEIAMERIGRSIDAALTAIYIITSPKMPKQVFLEDVIDRIVMFGKFQLTNTIYPEYDPVYRISPKNKDGYQGSSKMKRSRASQVKHKSTISLYNKLSDLVGCLAELVEIQELTDTIILQISGLGIAPFFVENVSELQLNAMKLVTTVFAYYDKHRQLVLEDIFASIARLPSSKRNLRSYRLNADEHIQMVTALALQLIQCVVRLPQPKETNNEVEDEQTEDFKTKNKEKSPKGKRKAAPSDPDVVIVTSYETAMRTGYNFLSVFLKKCTMKGEDDFRPMFENFVQDLLCTVNKPEWPASELLLSLLGKILVKQFSNKSIDMSLRTASLEYLGIVAARLRKDAVSSQLNQEVIDDIVNKVNESDEEEDEEVHKRSTRGHKTPEPKPVETMDVTQSLQKAMLDYLAYHGSSEPAYLFARQFYIAQWFRDTRKECEKNKGPDEDFDEEKEEKAIEQVGDTEERNKFLLSQVETNYKPYSSFKPLPTKLDYDSACLVARYLSSKRPFAQSFDIYLGQILKVLAENAVAIRTKAMKCLTSVVESDPGILARPDMERGVHGRFLDPSTSVREAAIELVGKFVLIRPELIPQYYNMLSARILDTGISVRKRVIKIFREIFTVQPDFNKIPDMCVKMIRRVNDEDGIKKLVNEVFQTMWFTPLSAREKDSAKLIQRVVNITEVVAASKDTGFEFIEQLLDNLLKKDEHGNYNKSALTSCRQIVDCLVENVLRLEEKSVDGKVSNRLSACLSTLYLFSKIKPDLMIGHATTLQPYLNIKCSNPGDYWVLHYVARILELVITLKNGKVSNRLSACLSTLYLFSKIKPDLMIGHATTLQPYLNIKCSNPGDYWVLHYVARILELVITLNNGKVSNRLSACLSTLYLFSKIKPDLMIGHATTLQPYLNIKCSNPGDYWVLHYVARILELVIPLMDHPGENFLAQVEEDMIKLILNHGMLVLESCVSCLGAVVNSVSHNYPLVKDCFRKFFSYIKKYAAYHKENPTVELQANRKPSLLRSLFTVGLMCKHFDFDKKDLRDSGESLKETIFDVLVYFTNHPDEDVQLKALMGLGFMAVRHYEYMLGRTLKSIYCDLLHVSHSALKLKCQVLKNLYLYLVEEEVRMAKSDAEWRAHAKEEDLKEMGDVQSGMASTIMQVYLKDVLESFFISKSQVRLEALNVIQLVLRQGLIHPVQCVPYLISMGTDAESAIRVKADQQLKEIDKKYPGFIHMKALHGIKMSFRLQDILQSDANNGIIRGLSNPEDNCSSLNAFLYSILRGNRSHRRALLTTLLNHLDDSAKIGLKEQVYLTDNLAFFAYQTQDEPLYIIHQIDIIVSVSGSNLLQSFREKLNGEEEKRPKMVKKDKPARRSTRRSLALANPLITENGTSEDYRPSIYEDDDDLDKDTLIDRLPDNIAPLKEIILLSQGCVLLLYLKQHLKDMYNFTDSKIQNYSPTEAAKVYDKPLQRKALVRFNPESVLNKLVQHTSNNCDDEEERENLADDYIQFRDLMLSVDPPDEDESDDNKSMGRQTPVTYSIKQRVDAGGDAAGTMNHVGENDTTHVNHEMNGEGDGESNQGYEKQSPEVEPERPRIPTLVISTSKLQTPSREKEKKKHIPRPTKALLPGASQFQTSAHTLSSPVHSHHTPSHHSHHSVPRSHHKTPSSQTKRKQQKKRKRARYGSDNSDNSDDSDYDPY